MNNILSTTLQDTYDVAELNKKIRILKTYVSSLLYSTSQIGILEESDLEWVHSFDQALLGTITKDNMTQIFDQIQKETGDIKILVIYTAVEFPKKEVINLGKFVRDNFGKDILIDMKFDPSLIAGAAFVWKGVYQDLSVRKKIDENKDEVLKQLKSFLK